MKKLLILVALSAVIVTPALAQAPSRNHAFHQHSSTRVHPYAANDRYAAPGYEYNNNLNPDYQLGGTDRWKPMHRASRHISQK
jgi:hypothetical protein